MLPNFRPLGHLALGLAAIVGSAAVAQTFSSDPNGGGPSVTFPNPEGGCGAITLTQSNAQTITPLNSVSCNAGGLHTDNGYSRAFSIAAFPGGFDVCEVQFGIETATGAGGSQPVTVNVYSNAGGAYPAGTATLVGTANLTVADQMATILAVPLTASIPPGTELVAEVFTPNGQGAGHSFFIGSNAAGETGPSFLEAADCGVTTPTPTSAIGFAGMNIVMNVIGDPVASDADVSITKTAAAPSPLVVGSMITYTLTAANAGPGDADNVVVTDSLPANLTYVSNTCAAAVAGQDVTWTIGMLANGANATCDIVTSVNNFGPIDNTANIATTTNDPTPGNNASTASLAGVPFPADVGVTLTSDAPMGSLGVGTQFTYTATATNAGPGTAADLAFTLTLSGKVSFVSSTCGAVAAGNSVTWTVASLGVGASTACAITVAVVAPGDLLSSVSVTTSTDDPNLVNNVAELVVGFVATQVPTLNQLGLLLLVLVLAGAAVVVIRR